MKDKATFLLIFIFSMILAIYFQIDLLKALKINSELNYNNYSSVNYFTMDGSGKLKTFTVLNKEQIKIQEESGCIACHEDYK